MVVVEVIREVAVVAARVEFEMLVVVIEVAQGSGSTFSPNTARTINPLNLSVGSRENIHCAMNNHLFNENN